MTEVAPMPDLEQVAELRDLLDLMENFRDNDQRARYLLSCNWMRDRQQKADKLAIALVLTQEYVGSEVLPPIEGWSWYDALTDYYGEPFVPADWRGPRPDPVYDTEWRCPACGMTVAEWDVAHSGEARQVSRGYFTLQRETVMARQARYVVRKADGIGGPPIPPDEPCIVIRGQDRLAMGAITGYIETYRAQEGADPQVIDELEQHRDAIAEWQRQHPAKLADR